MIWLVCIGRSCHVLCHALSSNAAVVNHQHIGMAWLVSQLTQWINGPCAPDDDIAICRAAASLEGHILNQLDTEVCKIAGFRSAACCMGASRPTAGRSEQPASSKQHPSKIKTQGSSAQALICNGPCKLADKRLQLHMRVDRPCQLSSVFDFGEASHATAMLCTMNADLPHCQTTPLHGHLSPAPLSLQVCAAGGPGGHCSFPQQ